MPLSINIPPFFSLCRSSFGLAAVLWHAQARGPAVCRILFSKPRVEIINTISRLFPSSTNRSCLEIGALKDRIETFLNGGEVKFPLDLMRFDRCSAFQKRVLRACCAIPRGRVSTYGLMAAHLKISAGSRAVGAALAANPFPIVFPCHRVICSDGSLGGYQGGIAMKKKLLAMEGVVFRDAGHIALSAYT